MDVKIIWSDKYTISLVLKDTDEPEAVASCVFKKLSIKTNNNRNYTSP